MSQIDIEEFKSFLPDRESLEDWQKLQYDKMVDMAEKQNATDGIYKWVAGHSGSLEDFWYKDYRVLNAHKGTPSWTYCCGVTLEHFLHCWKGWMEGDYESEIDMTESACRELRAYFFCYDDPPEQKYKYGSAGGIEFLGEHITKRWEEAKSKSSEPATFDNGFDLDFVYHTDPYTAKFGDYISLQPYEDPMQGGHSAIFLSLEKMERNGKMEDVVRVFNSNTESGNGYGYGSGIGLSWYWIEKYSSWFKRVLHFGNVREKEDSSKVPSIKGFFNFSGVFTLNFE